MSSNSNPIPVSIKNNDDGSIEFSHDSYGLISKNREHLNDSVSLFGLETKTKDVVSLSIKGVTIKEDLGDSLYIENETVVEIVMSASQFIDSFTNMNHGGTPCTIRETVSKGKIKFAHVPSTGEYLIDSINSGVDASIEASKSIVDDVTDIIGVTGSISKDDRLKAFKMVQEISRQLSDSFPHDVSSYSDVADRQKKEAKATIDLALTNKKDQIIRKSIEQNPDLLRIDDLRNIHD